MAPGLRTIALLMLLAGLSLGLFASRALRALGPQQAGTSTAGHGVPQRIEQQVELYQRFYRLDPKQTDDVRQTLLRYDRRVRDKLLELRSQNAEDFRVLYEDALARITAILEQADAPSAPR